MLFREHQVSGARLGSTPRFRRSVRAADWIVVRSGLPGIVGIPRRVSPFSSIGRPQSLSTESEIETRFSPIIRRRHGARPFRCIRFGTRYRVISSDYRIAFFGNQPSSTTFSIRPPQEKSSMYARTKRVLGAIAASVLLGIVALVSGIVPTGAPDKAPGAGPVSAQASNNFDQLVVVLFENHDITDIYGPATYMTQLANTYGISHHWQSTTNPSQPNYISLIGGSTLGVSGDGNHPNLNHPTIVDLIANSGKTWRAVAESAGGSGCGLSPPRGEDHFPFLSYTTITGNSARCANLISGDSNTVIAQLNAGVNFIWFTPTDNHNMHDNSVSPGDAWIAGWAPQLLTAMAGKKAALFIMHDEGYARPTLIYTSLRGPSTVLAHSSSASYTHYSFIKLLEDVWGGGNLGQGDVNAPSPLEFFLVGGPDFGITANPTSVSFGSGGACAPPISNTRRRG